jgi:hypothetical protein
MRIETMNATTELRDLGELLETPLHGIFDQTPSAGALLTFDGFTGANAGECLAQLRAYERIFADDREGFVLLSPSPPRAILFA